VVDEAQNYLISTVKGRQKHIIQDGIIENWLDSFRKNGIEITHEIFTNAR